MSHNGRPRILIVGAFSVGAEGRTGGTLAACRQLVASPLATIFDLVLVDTAAQSEAERRVAVRTMRAFLRVMRVGWLGLTGKLDAALLFSANGFSWLERCTLVILLKLCGVRVLLFPRTGLVIDELTRSALLRTYTTLAVRASAGILCQGDRFRRDFERLCPAAGGKTTVIANWIEDGAAPRAGQTAPAEGLTVLFIGWLECYKAIDVLINAVKSRPSDFAACRFVICGDGPERDPLERQAASAGVPFQFRGWIGGAEKTEMLGRADMLVLPSRIEGMPNVLLEAMAAGLPVVSTTVGCIPDLVADGVEGFLVPPDDSAALGEALVKLVRSAELRRRMGAAGREKILRDHRIGDAWRCIARLLVPGISTPSQGAQ